MFAFAVCDHALHPPVFSKPLRTQWQLCHCYKAFCFLFARVRNPCSLKSSYSRIADPRPLPRRSVLGGSIETPVCGPPFLGLSSRASVLPEIRASVESLALPQSDARPNTFPPGCRRFSRLSFFTRFDPIDLVSTSPLKE